MFHFFSKKCKHEFEVSDVKNISISVDDQLYTEKPNVMVTHKCIKCPIKKVSEYHMPLALEKQYTIEDFK
jgi:hypothetical protein